MQIREVRENEKEKWNKFVSENSYGDFLQSWEWGEVKKSPFWQIKRLAVFFNGKIIAAASIFKRILPFGFSLFYSPRGPVFDWKNPHADEILWLVLREIKKVSNFKTLCFKIGPACPKDGELGSSILNLEFVFYPRAVQPQHTSVVDLERKEEEILASFEKDTRYSVKRAKREGVKVKIFSDEDLDPLKKFYQIYQLTSKRGGFTPRPFDQFKKLWQILTPSNMVKLYLAYFKDEVLSGALIPIFGEYAYYLWGASTREYPKKFASYRLQWEIMKDLKKQGILKYDLWGIAPTDDPKHAWGGHTLFKKGFKGKRVDFIGDFDLPLSSFYYPYRLLSIGREKLFSRGIRV